MTAWDWKKMAKPGIVRQPWLDEGGHHVLVAIGRDGRVVQRVRLFRPEDEQQWVPFLEGLLDEREGAT